MKDRREQSDSSVLPRKSSNKAGQSVAEGMEGRELAKRNSLQSAALRTQGRARRGVAPVIRHAQSTSTAPADGESLEQCRSLTHGATRLVTARTGVGPNTLLVGQVALPGDVARMMVRNEHAPLATREMARALAHPPGPIQVALLTCLAVRVGAGVAGCQGSAPHRTDTGRWFCHAASGVAAGLAVGGRWLPGGD